VIARAPFVGGIDRIGVWDDKALKAVDAQRLTDALSDPRAVGFLAGCSEAFALARLTAQEDRTRAAATLLGWVRAALLKYGHQALVGSTEDWRRVVTVAHALARTSSSVRVRRSKR
jgi:hypothetical protein